MKLKEGVTVYHDGKVFTGECPDDIAESLMTKTGKPHTTDKPDTDRKKKSDAKPA